MTLDYDDLDRATLAHDFLRGHKVRATFFPYRSLSAESLSVLRPVQEPKMVHRIVVAAEDAEVAGALLTAHRLEPTFPPAG